MKRLTRVAGSSLIFAGTCIGAAMLALPSITATTGFTLTSLVFIGFCALMVVASLLILEVNLWLGKGVNLISMAHLTLGKWAELVMWIGTLILLYAINSAYVVGGSPVIARMAAQTLNLNVPTWLAAVLFTAIIGVIVFIGTIWLDFLNRFLMLGLIATYLILVVCNFPYVHTANLTHVSLPSAFGIFPIVIAIFTAQTVIPSISEYLHDDARGASWAIVIGCILPLIIYLLWELVILGSVPLHGPEGLIAIQHGTHQVDMLNEVLSKITNNRLIGYSISLFSQFAIITSFLGITLSLTDFLRDGLKLSHSKLNRAFCICLALLPPLLVNLFFASVRGIFNNLLQYAGIIVALLLVALPTAMVWRGRYVLDISRGFRVFGGKPMLVIMFIFSGLVILAGILSGLNLLPQ